MSRYIPSPIPGTSGADHLSYEITERLRPDGYASRSGAVRAWFRAVSRANERRRSLGYTPVSRPAVRVTEVNA